MALIESCPICFQAFGCLCALARTTSRAEFVVSLAERRLAPVPEVVAGLEDLLAMAKRGELRGFLLAGACDQRCEANALVLGDGSVAALLLATERGKARLLKLGEE